MSNDQNTPTNDEKSTLPSLEALSRRSPLLVLFMILFVLNWFAYYGFSDAIGGDALGTTPSTQGFVVTTRGRSTTVTETVWLTSLAYASVTRLLAATFMLTLAAVATATFQRRVRILAVVFFGLGLTATIWTVIRDLTRSLGDYFGMG